jgi:hypothetical protein
LHAFIRVGFNGQLRDILRTEFRQNVAELPRPDYIPLNFFLFNEVRDGADHVVADELVYQAITFPHSRDFDSLALFSFNLSIVGTWRGARSYQQRPAMWAFQYIADRVGAEFGWDDGKVSAPDIEKFVVSSSKYAGEAPVKLSTNLAYLYRVGGLSRFRSPKPTRWWLSALFLTLDRTVRAENATVEDNSRLAMTQALARTGFSRISGKGSVAKDIATNYFLTLYGACHGRTRFDDEKIKSISAEMVPQRLPNSPFPSTGTIDAFHRSDITARKSLPKVCEILTQYVAGFETIDLTDMDSFDAESWIQAETARALGKLAAAGVVPSMNSDDLTKLTRG